jgi:hypothetical protein
MFVRIYPRLVICAFAIFAGASAFAGTLLVEKAAPDDFPLVTVDGAAAIFYSPDTDAKVVDIATRDLAADIERVTGKRPAINGNGNGNENGNFASSSSAVTASTATTVTTATATSAPSVVIGTIGRSPLIDGLAASGRLEVSEIKGQWESFLIVALDSRTLVIAGSDPRGTAFGVYELSQAIGVSPWHWWADVAPAKRATLAIAAGAHRYGPPSVKYRGIFINDEDWGLHPWAAKNFEPENKGIGPKTYSKVFELLLRLKANTLWPAMHKVSPPFNSNPANAALAADHAIVMGSSHAEPMLRNNVGEWPGPDESFNFTTNRDGVLAYWEERLKTNGRFENIYTLGMRGIHDSPMRGGGTRAEKIALLEEIFAAQRALIAKNVSSARDNTPVGQIPQLFCAYKEVLDLYRAGLRVPDDVTVMFPDDNFGYIRSFPTAAERAAPRSGGYGIYYHVSYLGKPLSYLWLGTTPPALIWEEMSKARDLGADRVWILNVGDIKPAEIDIEFFLQMAWDIRRWNADTLPNFLPEWAAREFGPDNAAAIAALMEQYYTFNFARRPEHLQWWLPGEKPAPSTLSSADRAQRRDTGLALIGKLGGLRDRVPAEKQDAFYELVDYPVQGAVLANNRYFTGESAALKGIGGNYAALDKEGNFGDVLNGQLARITHRFNALTAGGKWNGIMNLEPADDPWQAMRTSAWRVPAFQRPLPPEIRPPLAVAQLASIAPGKTSAWRAIRGLGQSGNACALIPASAPAIPPERAAGEASVLVFNYTLAAEPPAAATVTARIHILPTHASDNSGKYRLAYAFDAAPAAFTARTASSAAPEPSAPTAASAAPVASHAAPNTPAAQQPAPEFIERSINDGGPAWEQGVLSNERIIIIALPPGARTAGGHKLAIYGLSPGMVVDRVTIE